MFQLGQGLQANIVPTNEFVLACRGPVHHGRLQSLDYGQVDGCVPASHGTIRNQNVCWIFFSHRDQSVWILAGPEASLLSSLVTQM